uniref:Uncharacterized protein n=1 Tax=Moniliophthora roreri TaxID=221103 RepID=A0A0W0G960_MONRR
MVLCPRYLVFWFGVWLLPSIPASSSFNASGAVKRQKTGRAGLGMFLNLHPLPSTLYPLPSTLYPLPSTLYPLPSVLEPSIVRVTVTKTKTNVWLQATSTPNLRIPQADYLSVSGTAFGTYIILKYKRGALALEPGDEYTLPPR